MEGGLKSERACQKIGKGFVNGVTDSKQPGRVKEESDKEAGGANEAY